MTYQLRITQSNGETQLHPIGEGEVTIGSSAESDISLIGEAKLLPKHILIAPRADQCWISTARGAPLWDEEGHAVDGGFVPWGSRLTLGACVFELQATAIAGDSKLSSNRPAAVADKSGEATKAPSPIIIMLLLCTLAYAAFGLVSQPEPLASALRTEAPALFESEQHCGKDNFGHRARRAEDDAFARSDRAVFDKQDGINAVELFSLSEACYRAGHEEGEAKYVAARGQALRTQLEEEYKVLRLRLTRALSEGDNLLAATQVKQLLALLKHRSDSSFVLSLRRLDLRLSKKELQL